MRRRSTLSRHEIPEQDDPLEPADDVTAQDLLLTVERSSTVYAALESLSPEQRQLLSLAFFRGYSHSEIAGFTGVPIGTVKTQIRRSLLALKGLIGESPEPQVQAS